MLGATYYADPSHIAGLPRGVMLYASQMIPSHAKNFYWELEIISLGENTDGDTGDPVISIGQTGTPIISIGFAPAADKKDGTWSNPVGTLLFHNNGRVVHYNGQSLLQWRSLRFDVQLAPGDTLGFGYEKLTEATNLLEASGRVYFTLNGVKLDQALENVKGNIYPVVHIQKKNVRVKANFGSHPFVYTDLQRQTNEPSEAENDSVLLSSMPFQEQRTESPDGFDVGAGHRRLNSYSSSTATCPQPLKEYSFSTSEECLSESSHMPATKTGSHIQPITLLDDDSDTEDDDDDLEGNGNQASDINSLLVKSWETRVFPIIRRRFRNETERKDGLEQIKGALSLGMADIARQTVEFLYEENGGIPRDLHLPTLDDIKEEVNKFSIESIRKGHSVIITNPEDLNIINLPKYCCPSMWKTFGLTGEVLEIDSSNQLVQVETYLSLEGVLVRYWYPISALEKPLGCDSKVGVAGTRKINISNHLVHKELLNYEYALSRLNCREAYTTLMGQTKKDDLPSLNYVDDNSPMATMIKSSILLFQDIDMENLQYLSNQCLAVPDNGNMLEKNLAIVSSSSTVLNKSRGKLSELFYQNPQELKAKIQDYISKVVGNGEDCFIDLSNQICSIIEHSPEMFYTEEIPINDDYPLKSSIHFPRASFLIASVKINKKMMDAKDMKDLTIQLQTLDGDDVRHNGQFSTKDIIQYPVSVQGFKQPINSAFPPIIMANDIVKVSHGGGDDMGFKLLLHSVPQEFPLTMLFLEQILEADPKYVTPEILNNVIGLLSRFFIQYRCPLVIKERLLHLLAELIRRNKGTKIAIMSKLIEEMKSVHELEMARKDFLTFSSYFQALFEVVKAYTDFQPLLSSKNISHSPAPDDKEPSPAASLFRRRMQISARRSTSPLSDPQNKSSNSWFFEARRDMNLLQFLLDTDDASYMVCQDDLRKIYEDHMLPRDFSRLLILRGLPKHFTESQLREEIELVLNKYQGAFKNDIFIVPVDKMEGLETLAIEEEITIENSDEEIPSPESVTAPDENSQHTIPSNSGMAVIQVRAKCVLKKVKEEMESNKVLNTRSEIDSSDLRIATVLPTYRSESMIMEKILHLYFLDKLFDTTGENFNDSFYNTLEEIYLSCYLTSTDEVCEGLEDVIALKFPQILKQSEGNMLFTFLYGLKQTRGGLQEGVKEILQKYGFPTVDQVRQGEYLFFYFMTSCY